jgi:hypothetical protein
MDCPEGSGHLRSGCGVRRVLRAWETLLAYPGSGSKAQFEPLQVGGPGAVEGPAGPPGVQPDQVDRGSGGGVFEGDLGQAEVAGPADAGDVCGLPL